MVDQTSAIFFPYRSVLRFLTLTSGAWDSAAMGLSGSLPSLALAALKSVRNAHHHEQWSHKIETGLQQRLERAAIVEAAPVLHTLCRAIARFAGSSGTADPDSHCSPAMEVVGVSALQEESHRLFSEAVRHSAPPAVLIAAVAGLGAAVFFGLMLAPLMVLYANSAGVAADVFQLRSTAFAAFPVIHMGVLATALILSLLPVFLIAGLMLTAVTSEQRVREAVVSLRQAHRELVNDAIQSGRLRIRTGNPKVEAAQWLSRFLRDQDSKRCVDGLD